MRGSDGPVTVRKPLHMASVCPCLNAVLTSHTPSFAALFRICRLSSFGALAPLDRLRAMLGNPPSSLLVKHMAIWSSEAAALCGLFARDLLAHITTTVPSLTSCLSEDSETFSASDEEDLFEPLSLPRTSRWTRNRWRPYVASGIGTSAS